MNFEGKKVLVTGDNGFIGSLLVEKLTKLGAEIVTLTDPRNYRIDIRNWNCIKNIRDLDLIYHLAAKTYVPSSYNNPRETYEVNVLGTLNALELARINNVEKFLFTSSYVYGNPKYLPIDENHPIKSMNPYSMSKILGEKLCKSYNEDFGLNCIIFRLFNLYGKNQNSNFLIPNIIKQLKSGKIKLKDPNPKRDYVHVLDVINALIIAGTVKENFEIFNIGTGTSYSVKEIVGKIIGIYGLNVEVKFSNEKRKNEIIDTKADIDKAKEKLGWVPNLDIDKGLREILGKLG